MARPLVTACAILLGVVLGVTSLFLYTDRERIRDQLHAEQTNTKRSRYLACSFLAVDLQRLREAVEDHQGDDLLPLLSAGELGFGAGLRYCLSENEPFDLGVLTYLRGADRGAALRIIDSLIERTSNAVPAPDAK